MLSQDEAGLLWQKLVYAVSQHARNPLLYKELLETFVTGPNYQQYLRNGLTDYNERRAYLCTPFIVKELSNDDKVKLLPELLKRLSYWSGQTDIIQEVIVSVPYDELIQPLEEALEPYFQNMDEQEVVEMLILCRKVSDDLTRKFATRAYQSTNMGVKEAGAENLQWLDDEAHKETR